MSIKKNMHHFIKCFFTLVLAAMTLNIQAQNISIREVYKVKKQDTVYGIAKKFDVSIDDLKAVNPEMQSEDYTLKKGNKINIPNARKETVQTKTNKKEKKATLPGHKLHVGIMLPLHDNDGDGKRMTEYYRGLIMGCDSLRAAGISTEIRAWNVDINTDIKSVLKEAGAVENDIIFGPLYTKQVKPLADFCQENNIRLVIPFSTQALDVATNPNVMQVWQNSISLNEKASEAFFKYFMNDNVIIVDCNDSESDKGIFTSTIRKEMEKRGMTYKIVNLKATPEQFMKAFLLNKKNVVILNTGKSPELNLVFRHLNVLHEAAPTCDISMFGYTEWLSYEKNYRELFHRYDVYIPSTFYYYKGISKIAKLENAYQQWFNIPTLNQYIPRFALTGYDHAQFFLRGLYAKGSSFNGNESIYKAVQSPLMFTRVKGGGYQNEAFLLVHYNDKGVIETINN